MPKTHYCTGSVVYNTAAALADVPVNPAESVAVRRKKSPESGRFGSGTALTRNAFGMRARIRPRTRPASQFQLRAHSAETPPTAHTRSEVVRTSARRITSDIARQSDYGTAHSPFRSQHGKCRLLIARTRRRGRYSRAQQRIQTTTG